MLENAPVTGTLLALSVLTTAVGSRLLEERAITAAQLVGPRLSLGTTTAAAAAVATRLASLVPPLWQRLALESFPCGLSSPLSMVDAVCACLALGHLRVLERRWGSASALSFSLVCSVVGAVVTELIGSATAAAPGIVASHAGSTATTAATAAASAPRILPGGLTRLLSGSALIVPLTAILVRILCEVPPMSDADVLRRIPLPAMFVAGRTQSAAPSSTSAASSSSPSSDPHPRPQQPANNNDVNTETHDGPGGALILTKTSVLMLLLVLKLTLIPDMLFTLTPSSSTGGAASASAAVVSRRQVHVLVDLGLATRLLLFLTGLVLGLWSSSPSSLLNRLCVAPLRDIICRPLLRLTRPLWQLAFGASRTVTHTTPPYLKAREEQAAAAAEQYGRGVPGGATVVDHGRMTVESLAHDPGVRVRRTTGQPQPQPSRAHRAATDDTTRARPAAAVSGITVDEEAVAQIRQLGLPVMDAEIRGALAAANGDVNGAVQLLLGSI